MHLAWLTAFLILPFYSSKKRGKKEKKQPPSKPRRFSPESVFTDTLTRSGAAQGYIVNTALDNPSLTLSPASTLSKSSENDGN